LVIGLFTTNPDEVAAVQNDRFMNVCDGTSLAAGLAGEGGDVVGDEPVHRRDRPRRRRVPRSRRAFTDREPVVVVENVEQLGVGVEVLLTRIRVG
jgi:hypothetical protein